MFRCTGTRPNRGTIGRPVASSPSRSFTLLRGIDAYALLIALSLAVGSLVAIAATRSPDIPFAIHMIDGGASETAAVADVNHDRRLDIVSGETWYEAPAAAAPPPSAWTKHRFREINYTCHYFDNFSDLPIDVDGDGYPDVAGVSWFAKKIVWWKNPGKAIGSAGMWKATDIDTGFPIEFAILVDLDNDGKAREMLAQENGTPLSWYEVKAGAWVKHVVSDQSYGHGIGAGDVNGDETDRHPDAARLARGPGGSARRATGRSTPTGNRSTCRPARRGGGRDATRSRHAPAIATLPAAGSPPAPAAAAVPAAPPRPTCWSSGSCTSSTSTATAATTS